ncbi:adenosylhomocysteine nucleosidase [Deinobacterium chartae]|uniref:adenosylhomocysteine nucleosidase n=1 Tax=Deinobacterium chartae TaxID=521158 RepID=A0A841HYY6_9DEIO|nr:5'-methylthioadenosine/adenosylhomocysteine nucleosidase [Deinobacterium chartae]MBB6097178.1 adenosylhomocysteine nucleosidase [Deinobacterium chartae]
MSTPLSLPLPSPATGIIGAMDQEIELLLQSLEAREDVHLSGMTFYRGVLEGRPVVLTRCGIGKVNAAMTTLALIWLGADRIIFTGVAGGVRPGLRVGDIVVSTDLVQHDLDASALGYALGQVPDEAEFSWEADAALRDLALEVASQVTDVQAVAGRIVSGDQFIASPEKVRWLQQTFDAAAAEMEGAAVAQVAYKNRVPFVVIRSLSDTADGGAHMDYPTFMPIAAARAKTVVREMLRRLR